MITATASEFNEKKNVTNNNKEEKFMFLLEMWDKICYIVTDTIETFEMIAYIIGAALQAMFS